ncbi:endolytic transglycosylase MltG [Gammaproteobacteria bacterium]|nr:endolytic transglycosylase MltG [Gammaproteobacteria bacterium]
MKLFKYSSIILIGLVGLLYLNFDSKFNLKKELVVDVKQGMSMQDISFLLQSNDLLYSTFFLNQYSRILGKSTQIKTGEYLVTNNDSIFSLLDKFSKGEIYYRSVRFKEGSTFSQLLLLLKQLDGIIDNLKTNPDSLIAKETGSKYSSMEGIFSPDTYYYKKGDTASSLLVRAYMQQKKELNTLWKNRMPGLPYKSEEDALTMASIIEKEGVEKKRIAGVFINRLNAKMRLQSDPTVIFALGKNFDGNIRKKDLRLKHPYNTYMIQGLPPGPISLVSLESIKAALQPEITNDYYFVSRGDGTHQFSATLEQHNKAVKEYQLK